MTDSYHFQIEPEPRVEVPKFRIGGVYRNRDGQTVVLSLKSYCGINCEWADLVYANVVNGAGEVTDGAGICRLSDGRSYFHSKGDDLIPGELIERDGEWVAADAPIVFPSGAAVLTSGDKIVGRVEASPGCVTVTILGGGGGGGSGSTPEPKRAPLDWNTTTPHDTFGPDFIVTKDAEPTGPLYDSPTTDSAYPAIAGLLRG